mgnify:CR=1 FL=1
MTKNRLNVGFLFGNVKPDLLAFAKWIEDYKVRPIAIEAMLVSKLYGEGFCLAIDLICELDYTTKKKVTVEDGLYVRGDKKGQVKYKDVIEETVTTKTFIVDYKSNFFEKEDKSFFDTQLFQLIAAEKAVMSNFTEIHIDGLANWSPNAWRKEPSYTFDVKKPTMDNYREFDLLMHIAQHKGFFRPSGVQFVPPDVSHKFDSTNYAILSQKEFVEQQLKTKSDVF